MFKLDVVLTVTGKPCNKKVVLKMLVRAVCILRVLFEMDRTSRGRHLRSKSMRDDSFAGGYLRYRWRVQDLTCLRTFVTCTMRVHRIVPALSSPRSATSCVGLL